MIEVSDNIWVGDQADYNQFVKDMPWRVVQACKEPYHRQALGYTGRAAPKNHPEYLVARRDNRLILNLVDVDDPAYIKPEIIDAALAFIADGVCQNVPTLVHCNQGRSRSPTIAMLAIQKTLPSAFDDAEQAYLKVYPMYAPAAGMREFAKARWQA